jgi:hypothetical protein
MAYYTALQTAWNSVTQPPTGVTGQGLVGGDTTAQKITKVNAWTIVGTIPTSFFVTGPQLANCVNFAEFKALTATQQTNLMALFQTGQTASLLGGSGNTTLLPVGLILDSFNVAGPTIANLTALAKATIRPWWQVPVDENGGGLSSPVSIQDTTAAGLV